MTKETKRTSRIISLDIAKAICIILVVVGHYIPDNSPAWYKAIHDIIYTFHMPLFMFASGYVYIATRKADVGYGNFLLKKVKRLLVPYLATSVIVISIKLLTQGQAYIENPVTMMSYLNIFTGPEAGYFLWFVWALWWMFVIVNIFKSKKALSALFAVSVLLHYVSLPTTELFCIQQTKTMFIWFMLGVMAQQYTTIRSFLTNYHPVKLATATCLFAICASATVLPNELLGGVIHL